MLQDLEMSRQTRKEDEATHKGNDLKYELAFYGGSFTAMPAEEQERLLDAALPFLSSGLLSGIRVSTRPDAIDNAAIDRLARYGVGTVELGAQSMRDTVLDAAGRGHTSEDTRRAARLLKSHGFSLILQMMTGLPRDDDEGAIYTAREFVELKPDGVRVYPTVVIKDTALCDMWRNGTYSEHTVEDAVRIGARIIPIFEGAGIPIIRFGLNPTEDLSGGDAVAGAYHPALGELAYARVMLSRASELMRARGVQHGSRVELGVNPRDISRVTGQHRANIEALTAAFGLAELKICATEVGKGEILLISAI